MAYLELQSTADYSIHKLFEVETSDYNDHSFCGIMFDVGVKTRLPVDFIEISTVWVRGELGPISVYVAPDGHKDKEVDKTKWKRVFCKHVRGSRSKPVALELDEKISIRSGERVGLYVHSKRPDDSAIVYDDQRNSTANEDPIIKIYSGAAHISPRPFSPVGMWGYGWRPNRDFVGRLSYGARFSMWRPEVEIHRRFPKAFQRAAKCLVLCSNREGSLLNRIPSEVTIYVLNMCRHDWFGDYEEAELTSLAPLSARRVAQVSVGEEEEGEEEEEEEDYGIGWHHRRYREYLQAHQGRVLENYRAMKANKAESDGEESSDMDDDELDEDYEDDEVDEVDGEDGDMVDDAGGY